MKRIAVFTLVVVSLAASVSAQSTYRPYVYHPYVYQPVVVAPPLVITPDATWLIVPPLAIPLGPTAPAPAPVYRSVSTPSRAVTTGAPALVAADGQFLGVLSTNKYDPLSVSNPYGAYGSQYSPTSITNPYGVYGSPYSPLSPNNPYTASAPILIPR